MKAMDIMVPDVVTIKSDASVADAVKLLSEHDVSALPVVDDAGALIGIVSEADLLRRAELGTEKRRSWWLEAMTPATTLADEFAKSHGRKIHEVMSTDVISASEDASLGEIATLLEKHRIKRVPIVRGDRLVGVVSRANLVQALATISTDIDQPSQSDRAIRLDLIARLSGQPWTGFGSRNVIVKDGVVHLWGLVSSEKEREALTALAEDVPGVKAVSDETLPAF